MLFTLYHKKFELKAKGLERDARLWPPSSSMAYKMSILSIYVYTILLVLNTYVLKNCNADTKTLIKHYLIYLNFIQNT